MSLIIEKRIWDYIDGDCSSEEAKEVAELIQTDPDYKALYQELTALNESMTQLELDEPSMSFNRNLMGKISGEPVPLKSLIDKRIINGITVFFLVSIFTLVIIAIAQVEWSALLQSDSGNSLSSKLPGMNFSTSTGAALLKAFYFLDAILSLYLIDMLLRRREKLLK